MIIQGAGGKSGGGAKEGPNTVRSEAVAKILDLICAGQIYGFVTPSDPLKSIYYDGLPVQNADGSFNNYGVEVEYTLGTMDQDPIKGFDSVDNTTPVNIQATIAVKPSVTVTNTLVDSVLATCTIPALTQSNSKTGALEGTWCSFQWEIKGADEGTWTVAYADYISEKFTTSTSFDYIIDISAKVYPVSIRLVRITADSGSVSVQNDLYFSAYTQIINEKLSYPGSALIAHTVQAKQFGSSIPSRGAHIYGQLCLIPSNYNPWTRVYTGVWNGTFVEGWTNNPAWVLLSCLVNTDWGLGEYISINDIDKVALYTIAQYCDESVDNGLGGTEARYSFNAYIQTQESAAAVIQAISSSFQGMTFAATSKVLFAQDSPSDPVALVTNANVIGGAFQYEGIGVGTRKSAYMVEWNNPDKNYELDYEFCEDPELIAKYGYKMERLPLLGCTSKGQARRAGRWRLFTNKFQDRMIAYKASLDHGFILPGALIRVADARQQTYRYGGRIVSSTNTTATLDAPTTLVAGKTYQLHYVDPAGNIQTRTITTGVGETSTVTVSATMAGVLPANGTVWIITSGEEVPYRVMGVREVGGRQPFVEIVAAKHYSEKYALIEGTASLEVTRPYSVDSKVPILPPTNAVISKKFRNTSGMTEEYLDISFTPSASKRAQYYSVSYRHNYGEWKTVTTYTDSVQVPWNGSGRYQTSIVARGIGDEQDQQSIPLEYESNITDVRTIAKPTISGLALATGSISSTAFGGGTAKFTWGVAVPSTFTNSFWEDPYFRDFEIEMRTTGNVLIATYYTRSPFFEFTSERNAETNAGVPRRAFKMRVRIRDTFASEVVGDYVELSVSNPAPATPTGVVVTPVTGGLRVVMDPPADLDWKGTLVWTSQTAGITLPGTPKDLGKTTVFNLTGTVGSPLYYRFAFYDEFGKDTLNATAEASTTIPLVTTTDLGPESVTASKIQARDTSNMIPDSGLRDAGAWSDAGTAAIWELADGATYSLPTARCITSADNATGVGADVIRGQWSILPAYYPECKAVEVIAFSVTSVSSADFVGDHRVYVQFFDRTKTFISETLVGSGFRTTPWTTPATDTLLVTAPANTAFVSFRLRRASTAGGTSTGRVTVYNMAMRKASTVDTIAAAAIEASKIAPLAVDTGALANGAVSTLKLGSLAVDTGNLAAGAVTNAKLGSLAVDTGNLIDSAVSGLKIASNTITAANIAANTITASRLILTDTSNMVKDAEFNEVFGGTLPWRIASGNVTRVTAGDALVTALSQAIVSKVTGNGTGTANRYDYIDGGTVSGRVPIEPLKPFYASVDIAVTAGFNGLVYADIAWVNSANADFAYTTIGTPPNYLSTPAGSTIVTTVSGRVTAPAGAVKMHMRLIVDWNTDFATRNKAGTAGFARPIVRRAVNAELIVDGAITAAKIQAATITGDRIAARTITADTLVLMGGSLHTDNNFRAPATYASGQFNGSTFDWFLPGTLTGTSNHGWYVEENNQNGADRYMALFSGRAGQDNTKRFYIYSHYPTGMTIRDLMPCTAGRLYELAVSAFNNSNQNIQIDVDWYDRTNTYVSSSVSITVPASGTSVFTNLRAQILAPTNAVGFRWYARNVGGSTLSGAACISNVTVREAASGTMIVDGTITASKIFANTITGDKIAANTISASKLVVADTTNLFPDAPLSELAAYSGIPTGVTLSTTTVMRSPGAWLYNDATASAAGSNYTGGLTGQRFVVDSSRSYFAELQHYAAGAGTSGFWSRIQWYDYAGAALSGGEGAEYSTVASPALTATGITNYSNPITPPAGARFGALIHYFQRTVSTRDFYIGAFSLRLRSNGQLIVDGTISADKIVSNSITALQIAGGSITASKLVIADNSNLLRDPDLLDVNDWTVSAGFVFGTTEAPEVTTELIVPRAIRSPTGNGTTSQATTYTYSSAFPVLPSAYYRIAAKVNNRATFTGRAILILQWYDRAGAYITNSVLYGNDYRTTAVGGTSVIQTLASQFQAPSNAYYGAAIVGVEWSTIVANNTSGRCYFGALRVQRAADSDLIVDGSITALKLRAGEITADRLVANAGMFVGSGTNLWSVALEPKNYLRSDGDTVSFGLDFGAPADVSWDLSSLPSLAVGERYDAKVTSSTGTGFTCYLKKITSGGYTTYTQTTDSAGAGGDPTRIANAANAADSASGNYTFRVIGDCYLSEYTYYISKGVYGTYYQGAVSIECYFYTGSAWVLANTFYVEVNGTGVGLEPFDVELTVNYTGAVADSGKAYGVSLTDTSNGQSVDDLHTVSYSAEAQSSVTSVTTDVRWTVTPKSAA